MRHHRIVANLVTVVPLSAGGVRAHEVERARSDRIATQEVFDLLEDLWADAATERMRYLAGKHDRDAATADLARKTAQFARQDAYLSWLTAGRSREPASETGEVPARQMQAQDRYLAADCDVRRLDVEVARIDHEWAAIWLASNRDLREQSVATRPDIIEAEYDVRKAEPRMTAAVARVRGCEEPKPASGTSPKIEKIR